MQKKNINLQTPLAMKVLKNNINNNFKLIPVKKREINPFFCEAIQRTKYHPSYFGE
jgi:hypothetical protein